MARGKPIRAKPEQPERLNGETLTPLIFRLSGFWSLPSSQGNHSAIHGTSEAFCQTHAWLIASRGIAQDGGCHLALQNLIAIEKDVKLKESPM